MAEFIVGDVVGALKVMEKFGDKNATSISLPPHVTFDGKGKRPRVHGGYLVAGRINGGLRARSPLLGRATVGAVNKCRQSSKETMTIIIDAGFSSLSLHSALMLFIF
jgi:hypothetical protein